MHRLIFPFFVIQVLGQPESIGVYIFFRYVSHTNVEMVDNKLEAQKRNFKSHYPLTPALTAKNWWARHQNQSESYMAHVIGSLCSYVIASLKSGDPGT